MRTLLLIATLGFGFGLGALAQKAEARFCDDPLRDQDTCYKMKTMARHLELLDAQRDLMQINYPYIEKIGLEVRAVIKTLRDSKPRAHLAALTDVDQIAADLASQALQQNVKAISTANQIKNRCLACHANSDPSSGIKWEEVAEGNWDNNIGRCNLNANFPYLCKSMNGMRSVLRYYIDGYHSDVQTFELMNETAKELKRITTDLIAKKFFHVTPHALEDIRISAEELMALTGARDESVFMKAFVMGDKCFKCHAQ
jgi:hypothetical protein